MIWVGGRIVPDDALSVSVLDRALEHGLGLFETFRTWNGHPTLLTRHLARLQNSARALRLPFDPAALPDAEAASALRTACGFDGDATLRITLTGGLNESEGSLLWMRAAPLPPTAPGVGAVLNSTWGVSYGDVLARHKTLNYWRRRQAYEYASARGEADSISRTRDDAFWEGSRMNLFLVKASRVVTPPAEGPIVPGIMRGLVLERARAVGLETAEESINRDSFTAADEAFLTNSVRGIVPVRRAWEKRFPCPGLVTERLRDDLLSWLNRGGEGP